MDDFEKARDKRAAEYGFAGDSLRSACHSHDGFMDGADWAYEWCQKEKDVAFDSVHLIKDELEKQTEQLTNEIEICKDAVDSLEAKYVKERISVLELSGQLAVAKAVLKRTLKHYCDENSEYAKQALAEIEGENE